jgi:transcriptional regulator with XRE-family HTH domain
MILGKYLLANGLTQAVFATAAGLDQSTVSRLVLGRANPSLDLLRHISDVTGGKVTPNDFLKAPPTATKPRRGHALDSGDERMRAFECRLAALERR